MIEFLVVIILSIVEGLTEFLPISSTGHLILTENLLKEFIPNYTLSKSFMDTFMIVIQFGAIIAVVVCFWNDISPFTLDHKKFKSRMVLWSKIIVGVIPAGVIGILGEEIISEFFMDNIYIIATTLIFYGIIFIIIDKKFKRNVIVSSLSEITYKLAFIIGIFQCLAMIPGTSRSGATIIGALLLGFSRPISAEFSFFLAIPTMAGATLLKLMKNGMTFNRHELLLIVTGTVVSFLVAYAVIKWFMGYIKSKDFTAFGIYRIILGIIIFLTLIF